MTYRISRGILIVVAAFYAYGALVHVLNMMSLTGFDWRGAPLKWQILDVVYLVVDVVAAVGLAFAWRIGFVAFFAAATSQIVLYTALRSWILDVPEEYRPAPEQIGYLDTLVLFHVVTIAVVAFALWLVRHDGPAHGASRREPSAQP